MPGPFLHRTRSRAAAVASVAGLVVGAAAGCGSSGRELRAPAPGATAPPRSTSTTAPAASSAEVGLSISSPAWRPGGDMPSTFTCDGQGTSPPLVITGERGAGELVVVVTASGGAVHWVLASIDPGGATISDGAVPGGGVVGLNSDGEASYAAPCPEPGETDTYEFTVHALRVPSGITATTPAAQAEDRLAELGTSSAATSASYARPS